MFVEHGILASILILGVIIAMAARMPLAACAPLIAAMGLFHGYAHGIEAPQSASGLAFGAGFVLTTIALHLIGMGLGLAMGKTASPAAQPLAFRLAGIGIIVAGIVQAM